jgi:hypothetical protein
MTTYGATNSSRCACKVGFETLYDTDGSMYCSDVDECEKRTDSCDIHATCVNIPGSYTCNCNPGYSGDGFVCVSIDECAKGLADCDEHASCFDTPGSFYCACRSGYVDAGPTGSAAAGVHCAVDNRLRAAGGSGSTGPTISLIANQQVLTATFSGQPMRQICTDCWMSGNC